MEKTVTHTLEREESARQGWYLNSRDRFVVDLLLRALGDAHSQARVLDAGCGTGGVLTILNSKGIAAVGTEMSQESLAWGLRQRRIHRGLIADVTRLPFPDGCFDYVVSSEVLEHVDDDVTGLRELLRVSRRGVLVTVPAHMYLWTDSDRILLHKRRYSRKDLELLAAHTEGVVRRSGSYAFLPGVLVMLYKAVQGVLRMGREPRPADSEALPLAARFRIPNFVDTLLSLLFGAELRVSYHGWLPWGHSWWMWIEKR